MCDNPAYVIACVVSFRSLFVRQARLRQLHGSILETYKTLEDWTDSETETNKLPDIPSGLMTVGFNDDSKWMKDSFGTKMPYHESHASVQGLVEGPEEVDMRAA